MTLKPEIYGYCRTCEREFASQTGLMNHRTMHRKKREDCIIEFANGNIRAWRFSKRKE